MRAPREPAGRPRARRRGPAPARARAALLWRRLARPSALAAAPALGALAALALGAPALAAALALAGCAVGTAPCEPRQTYAVTSPPPGPLPETPSARPTPGMVWVPGYWHWDAIRYVWVPGHWETPPPGRRWLPAETRGEGDGYRYYAGVWGCESGG
jgi:hypothetical protein